MAAKPKFQLPFKCGTRWQLNTWDHNPALDMVLKGNRNSEGQPVRASYAGRVAAVWRDGDPRAGGAGNMIIMSHGNGWWTAYYHLKDFKNSEGRETRVGDQKKMYNQIGHVGNTGDSNGPHLHYEQRYYTGSGLPTQSNRVAAHFNLRQFTGNPGEWLDVVSHNCTWERPTLYCQYRVKNTPWGSIAKRSFSGTKYDSEGRIADGTVVMAGLNGTREDGAWRRLRGSGGSDNRGPWVSSTWLTYLGGTGCPI